MNGRRTPRVLYITFDGILEPLGNSQILEPLAALARRGTRYHLLSMERPADLADSRRVAATQELLGSVGASWTFRPYRTGGRGTEVARNVADLTRLALRIARTVDIQLIHARAHLAAAVAWTVRNAIGVPYLFDFRGYWVDEQREQGRWVTRPVPYRVAKLGEGELLRAAAGVVTLTDLAAGDLRARIAPERPVMTITTLADYERFTIAGPSHSVPEATRTRLADKLVVAYIGAINASYAVDPALRLFRELSHLRPTAHLLCLTRQETQIRARADSAGVDPRHMTVASPHHDEMPGWLRLVDWGLLLLNSPFAKRGSMPTKLGEFFAAGVRPLQHGCNAEVSSWVRRAGSGYVLGGLRDTDLREAAAHVAARSLDEPELARAREITREHFALDRGIPRYERILETLGSAS